MAAKAIYTTAINELKACRHGYMLYNKNDLYVGRSFQNYGEFSEAEIELFKKFLKPDDVVLDMGANIGAHTLYFSHAVTHTGAVIAFEPQRIVFQTLCANMALNSRVNVHCYQRAVGEQPGSVLIPPLDYAHEANYGGLALGGYEKGESVPVLTIDSLHLSNCDFIKLDIEGMEKEALMGAQQTIKQHQPLLYVENDRPEKSSALIEYIMSLDYALYWHLPPLYNPSNYFQNAENIFANTVSVNMFCLPRDSRYSIKGLRQVKDPNDTWQ